MLFLAFKLSNPTDPAARIARRAVKEDEAKKLDQKLDRQGRVQAKRTQRVGERRLKTAGDRDWETVRSL